MHLLRYHGGFAPHSRLRAAVTLGGVPRGGRDTAERADKPATSRHVAMGWAQRLKRVFGIGIETRARSHGRLQVIASIEGPEVRPSRRRASELIAPFGSWGGLCRGSRQTGPGLLKVLSVRKLK